MVNLTMQGDRIILANPVSVMRPGGARHRVIVVSFEGAVGALHFIPVTLRVQPAAVVDAGQAVGVGVVAEGVDVVSVRELGAEPRYKFKPKDSGRGFPYRFGDTLGGTECLEGFDHISIRIAATTGGVDPIYILGSRVTAEPDQGASDVFAPTGDVDQPQLVCALHDVVYLEPLRWLPAHAGIVVRVTI